MHKINPRYIINGTLGIILVFATAYVIWQKGFVLKYGLALLVAFVLGVYNLYHCFDNDWEDGLKNNTDERDLFIAMKSGQKIVQLMNLLLYAGSIITIVLYGITKKMMFMIAGTTLVSVVVVMFVIFFVINNYYEKHG